MARVQILELVRSTRDIYRSATGFWGRFYSLAGIVITATLYNISPYGLFKLASAVAFLFFSEAAVMTCFPSVYTGIIGWLRTLVKLRSGKGVEWKPLTPGMRKIAEDMGVRIREFGVMDGLDNAFSLPLFKKVVIGRPLYESLGEKALEAVFAHELAHVKERHNLVPTLAIPMIMSQLLLWLTLPMQLFVIAGLAFSRLAMIPFNWMVELRADEVAARVTGRNDMIEALKNLDGVRMDEPSETHPPLRRRIEKLMSPVSRWSYVLLGTLLFLSAVLPWLLASI